MPLLGTIASGSVNGFRGSSVSAAVAFLFPFTTHTFTTGGTTGRFGPTIATLRTAYSSQTWASNASYFFQGRGQGYQVFQIPVNGIYEIEAAGAKGQAASGWPSPGQGAIIKARFSLTTTDKLEILVGQTPPSPNDSATSASAGGGGSFVVKYGTNDALVVAGGGGGRYSTATTQNTRNGQTRRLPIVESGSYGFTQTASFGGYGWDSGAGGGFLGDGNSIGGSGAGTTGDGLQPVGTHGKSFINSTYPGIGGTGSFIPNGNGGFGGGGGGHTGNNAGGGGGGYTGGNGGQTSGGGNVNDGQGGGSFISTAASTVSTSNGQYDGSSTFGGSSITNLNAFNDAAGYVKVTLISTTGSTGGGSSGTFTPDTFVTFAYTGSDQSWSVPSNASLIRVWAWGAGGMAGNSTSGAVAGGDGAGGGALYVPSLTVTPGESLTVVVGGTAQGAVSSNGSTVNGTAPVYGGGGQGGNGDGAGANGAWGGNGGGASGIKRSSTWLARAYGGAGGGGGGYTSASQSPANGPGSGTGGLFPFGINGSNGNNGTDGGGGGASGGSGSSQNTGSGRAGSNGAFVNDGGTPYPNSGRTPGNTSDTRYPTTGGSANAGLGGLGNASGASLSGNHGYVVIGYSSTGNSTGGGSVTTYGGSIITYIPGLGGAGGVGANNGANGEATTVIFEGTTLTANGGAGGLYNVNSASAGGTASNGDTNSVGGTGRGSTGFSGGGGGGGLGAANATTDGGTNGDPGSQAADISGLSVALGFATPADTLLTGGSGGAQGTAGVDNVGGAASGFGGGGGGAGANGGSGGNGKLGGGGGGAASITSGLSFNGGGGGNGSVVVYMTGSAGYTTSTVVLTAGNSYTIPANTTGVKIWAIGGGGGGGGAASANASSAGGGAGGMAVKSWSAAGASETPLYAFTTFTFTPAAKVGRYGPTSASLVSTYGTAGASWASNAAYFTQGRAVGYQVWTAPSTGVYEIEAAGARGQNGSSVSGNYGRGAKIRARVNLAKGQKLEMVVGQVPGTGGSSAPGNSYAGAGGGSFVVENGTSTPIIIAGGGGGSYSSYTTQAVVDGQTKRRPLYAGYSYSPAISGSNPGLGAGGEGYHAGGGGGLLTSGQDYSGFAGSSSMATDPSGQQFTHGASFIGGPVSTGGGTHYATGGNATGLTSEGGFGGGGGGHSGNNTGGGGGGYSGGLGGQTSVGGSYLSGIGGGSFIIASATNVATSDGQYDSSSTFSGSAITNIGSYNDAEGYIKITLISVSGGTGGGGGSSGVAATGGTFSTYTAGATTYKQHIFTANGNFVATSGGTVEVLVVGGGGGGGVLGGGGGGGAVIVASGTVSAGTWPVVVGQGGTFQAGWNTSGDIARKGSSSSVFSVTALGGGGARSYSNGGAITENQGVANYGGLGNNMTTYAGQSASFGTMTLPGGWTGTIYAGQAGGIGSTGCCPCGGGGGGGAGGPGINNNNSNSTSNIPSGGPGVMPTLNGVPMYNNQSFVFGGGGGADAYCSQGAGLGGSGGGGGGGDDDTGGSQAPGSTTGINPGGNGQGSGGSPSSYGGNGGTNTGGGGGAGSNGSGSTAVRGGVGGSGIVVIRYT